MTLESPLLRLLRLVMHKSGRILMMVIFNEYGG